MIDEHILRSRDLLQVVQAIANRHCVTLIELGDARGQSADAARRAAYAALSDRGLSSAEIGAIFQRDHTTVLAGIRRTRRRQRPRRSDPTCPRCKAQIVWQDPPDERVCSSYAVGRCQCQDTLWELRIRQERQKTDAQ